MSNMYRSWLRGGTLVAIIWLLIAFLAGQPLLAPTTHSAMGISLRFPFIFQGLAWVILYIALVSAFSSANEKVSREVLAVTFYFIAVMFQKIIIFDTHANFGSEPELFYVRNIAFVVPVITTMAYTKEKAFFVFMGNLVSLTLVLTIICDLSLAIIIASVQSVAVLVLWFLAKLIWGVRTVTWLQFWLNFQALCISSFPAFISGKKLSVIREKHRQYIIDEQERLKTNKTRPKIFQNLI